MRTRVAALSVAAAFVLLTAATPAAEGVSHSINFKAGKVTCGLVHGGGVECFSPAVPNPFGTEGYLFIRRHGPVIQGERGDCAFLSCAARPDRLARGERWARIGVHCIRKAVLRCINADHHGFRLTFHRYRTF